MITIAFAALFAMTTTNYTFVSHGARIGVASPADANEPRQFLLLCDPGATDATLAAAGVPEEIADWWHVAYCVDGTTGDEDRDFRRLLDVYDAGVEHGFSPRVFKTKAVTPAGKALERRFLSVPRRPKPEQRSFRSRAVDDKVAEVTTALRAQGEDKLALMFENCFPNTLDTTVSYRKGPDGDDETFVYTGDIHAMWLRDSAAQVWPYLRFVREDEPLRRMVRGVVRKQFELIRLDPYANAFNDLPPEEAALPGEIQAGVRVKRGVYERKYELDSLCYPIRLAYGYWKASGDGTVFDERWLATLRTILAVMREQQHKTSWKSDYFFARPSVSNNSIENNGWGRQVKPVGLVASSFRPSDDATQLPFLVPSNLMAADVLGKAAEILETVNGEAKLAEECRTLKDEIREALARHAVREHPTAGRIYAFEVDGFGSALFMDDANVPSLIAIPYFTDCLKDDPVYRATRAFVWSEENPWFFRGRAGEGIGGPHCGYGSIWPMSVILKGLTTDDPAEVEACLAQLLRTDAGTSFIHESHDRDDASRFSRTWFAWANTLFGELVLKRFESRRGEIRESAARSGADANAELFGEGDFFVGCNYWARHAGMYMWSCWRPDVVERDFDELARQGVTVMRVFPLWSDFQPLTGDCAEGGQYRSYRFRDNRPLPNAAGVDDEMVRRFSWLCDCAERHGIRLVVGLVTGWMSGRQFVPSVFEEKDVLADPEAVMWQTRYVKYLVSALKGKRAIAAWDLGNECNCMGGKTQAAFYDWMDHIGMAIRISDPSRPVVSGMHGLSTCESARCPIRLNGELMDVLCTHPYSFYVPGCAMDPFDTMRAELHPTAESLLYSHLGGRPCFIEEVGNIGTSCNSETRTAAGTRVMLFSAWANDLKGLLWWCNADQEGLDFPPYDLTAYERELGLLRDDYSPKPVMSELREFQRFRRSLPFAKLPRRKSDAVIVVSEKMAAWPTCFGAYLLCRQAGIDPDFAGAERDLPASPLYVVCSSEDEQAYTYSAQRRVFAKARDDGATVLVIYGAMNRFTHLAEMTGLETDFGTKAPCTRTFSLGGEPDDPMTCDDRWTCRLKAKGAEVLAETTDGEPAFTRFALGKGRVFVINSPVDRAAVARTDVFHGERVVPYYRLFRAAAEAAGVTRTVVKGDCPQVVLTEHPAENGRVIVIAINCEPRPLDCPIRVEGKVGAVWRGDVTTGRISLGPNEAAVFEVLTSRAPD